jgi:hypothetical protein
MPANPPGIRRGEITLVCRCPPIVEGAPVRDNGRANPGWQRPARAGGRALSINLGV